MVFDNRARNARIGCAHCHIGIESSFRKGTQGEAALQSEVSVNSNKWSIGLTSSTTSDAASAPRSVVIEKRKSFNPGARRSTPSKSLAGRALQLASVSLITLCGWGLLSAEAASHTPTKDNLASGKKSKFVLPRNTEWLATTNVFHSAKLPGSQGEFSGLLLPTNFIATMPQVTKGQGNRRSVTSDIFNEATPAKTDASLEHAYVYLTNTAPTADYIPLVDVTEDDPNSTVSLWNYFSDAEDSDSQLTFTITNNTTPTSFSSVSINPANGVLTLDYAPDENTAAVITIRATDTGGLWIQQSVYVWITPVNDPPVISNFVADPIGGGNWLFTGILSDVDDDVTLQEVKGFGVLAGKTAYADVDGSFGFGVVMYNWGTGSCKSWDPHDLVSNTAAYFVSW